MPPLIALLATWLGFVGLIWVLFERTEKILTDDARRSITDWLKNVEPKQESQAWLQAFTGILNRVFGTDYLSRKTFGRSCMASAIALALMVSIYCLKVESPLVKLTATPNLILIWLLASFIVDYVSLCESRGAISMMGHVGTGGVILILIGDFILTTIIFVTCGAAVLMALQDTGSGKEIALLAHVAIKDPQVAAVIKDPNINFDPEATRTKQQVESAAVISEGISHTVNFTIKGFLFWRKESTTPLFGIFFCSTFITSVWVWLYALGGLVIKAIQYLGFGTAKLRRWLDIENQPMSAIGYVCMILLTLGFVLILIF